MTTLREYYRAEYGSKWFKCEDRKKPPFGEFIGSYNEFMNLHVTSPDERVTEEYIKEDEQHFRDFLKSNMVEV